VSLDIAKHIPYHHETDTKPCSGLAFVRGAQYRYPRAVAGRDLDAGGGISVVATISVSGIAGCV
jgi:hypothetical protein